MSAMTPPIPEPLPELLLSPLSRPVLHYLTRTYKVQDRDPYDLDAPYQRGSVWTVEQRCALIKSLRLRIPTGAVVIATLPYSHERHYRVVDGKQRIETLRLFAEDGFTVPGWWFQPVDLVDPAARARDVVYTDLSDRGRRSFENGILPSVEFDSYRRIIERTVTVDGVSKVVYDNETRTDAEAIAAEAEVYGLINQAGTVQDDETLARAAAIAGTEFTGPSPAVAAGAAQAERLRATRPALDPLPVWGTIVYPRPLRDQPGTNYSPQRRAVVAAKTRTAAARRLGILTPDGNVSRTAAANISETGNEVEVGLALCEPGQVWVKPGDVSRIRSSDEWVRAALDPDRPWMLTAEEPV